MFLENEKRSLAGRLEDQRRASTVRGRAGLGAFAVEGERLVRRGLRAGWLPRQLLVAESLRGTETYGELLEQYADCLLVPDEQLLALSHGRAAGRVQALFVRPPSVDLQRLVKSRRAARLLVLLGVEDPGNIGALVRTALAGGADALVYVGAADPFHPKAVRTSLGSLFRLPLIDGAQFSSSGAEPLEADETEAVQLACLRALHREGVTTFATVPRGGELLSGVQLPQGPIGLLMGHEGQGLSTPIVRAAQRKLSIEQSTEADSYSVNAAAAICLYQLTLHRSP